MRLVLAYWPPWLTGSISTTLLHCYVKDVRLGSVAFHLLFGDVFSSTF